MKIIDISQEVLSCKVYEGDPAPKANKIIDMEDGGVYNLSALSLCAHNGTHVDAPLHFFCDGKSIDEMALEHFVGECYVAEHMGNVKATDAREILAVDPEFATHPLLREHIKGLFSIEAGLIS